MEAIGNRKYLPILESWEQIDSKKVKKRIGKVIAHLKQSGHIGMKVDSARGRRLNPPCVEP